MTESVRSNPPPSAYNLPFDGWREGQFEAIQQSLASRKRFVVHAAPTGMGKSILALSEAWISNKRTLILTSSKALQTQYTQQAQKMGLLDVRGQKNYICLASLPDGEHYDRDNTPQMVDDAPCHYGALCSLKERGCTYYDKLREARKAQLVISNYSMWLASNIAGGEGLGTFPLLVLDEAHDAEKQLQSALTIQLPSQYEIQQVFGKEELRNIPQTAKGWIEWARFHKDKLQQRIKRYGQAQTGGVSLLHGVFRAVERMSSIAEYDNWILGGEHNSKSLGPCVRLAGYAERLLFNQAHKVLFMSATVNPKTAELLGCDSASVDFFSYKSTFPPERRPVYFLPTVRMHYAMQECDDAAWVRRVDQILAGRLDRKGVIHTVSFARARLLRSTSRYASLMLFNERGDNTHALVEQFKQSESPCILVSPSVDTGFDFSGDECEYIIIVKVPFPDSSDPFLVARSRHDPDYSAYLAGQKLVQMAGRGMRSPTDRCETFILDSTFGMYYGKYRSLLPEWFWRAVQRRDTIPQPLEKIAA